jgi:hypothetical protein
VLSDRSKCDLVSHTCHQPQGSSRNHNLGAA